MVVNKVRMKRHETFSIREGWLSKGLVEINKDPKVFSSSDATDRLGIGTNMVKSLKYWMYATTLILDQNKEIVVSDFGRSIITYDPYFEDIFTWWLLHIRFITNSKDSFVYQCFFNFCISKTFSKEDIFKAISKVFDSLKLEYNEKTLLDEVNMIIKMYVAEDNQDNPENNFTCPLSELELIRKIGKDKYERAKPNYRKLDFLVVYYLLLLVLKEREYISIDDFIQIENGPSRLLNLDKNLVYEYLDEMKKENLILINKTAGLNMIYLRRNMSLSEIMKEYFSRR